MNSSDIRSMKCYITNCLEPALKTAQKGYDDWAAKETAGTGLDLDLATKMRRWEEGRISALNYAINEFKELFAEELKED
jgi:hypothetical protein